MKQTLSRYLKNLTISALVLYLLICLLLYLFQEKALFHPQPHTLNKTSEFLANNPDFDTLPLTMPDGTRISIYLSADSFSAKRPLVLYFGGNAEDVSHLTEYTPYFSPYRLALVNYRGFGLSQGAPSEQTMFSDAIETYDQLIGQPGIDASQIIIVGRSIGTGVATYLSSKRAVKATVLITPYESMASVSQEHYPFLPVSLLLKHRFESARYAREINTPVLALLATHDRVIPPAHGRALMQDWKGRSQLIEIDANHNSIMQSEESWQAIRDFIKAIR